jgi:hypothetical protein
MKRILLASAVFASLACAGVARADDGCNDPVADWQPREVLRQRLEAQGWKVQRIKVDDGCYEVRGIDKIGNSFEAKFAPASLRIRTLEISFRGNGNAADYLDRVPGVKQK